MPKHHEPAAATPPPWESTFATEVQRRREAQGLSQSELARRAKAEGLNIWQSAIGRIESGDRQVTLNEALTLAKVLGADPMDMAAFSAAGSDEIDLAILATRAAQKVARASFESVGQAWSRLDDAELVAEQWYTKATAASEDAADLNLGDTLDQLRAMAHALEQFLDAYSDENHEPLVGLDPDM